MVESSQRCKPWRLDVKHTALELRPESWYANIDAAIFLSVTFVFARPKNHFRTNGQLKPKAPAHCTARIGDVDKLSRSVLDSLSMELFTTTTLKSSASLHTNVTPMIENNPAPSSPLQPLIEALVEFHKTVPPINKTASAQYGKFADLETVLSTVTPHLLKNGLVISQGFEPSSHDNNPVLITQLLHISGAKLVSRLPMVVAGRGKNPLHDFGGSCTYSRRYSLLAILGLTADMDVDGDFADEKPATKSNPAPAPKVKDVNSEDQPLSEDERKLL